MNGGTGQPLLIGAGQTNNYVDTNGLTWLSDRNYSGGTTSSTTASITNTANPALFQNYRTAAVGNGFTYTINPTSGGRFLVSELEAEPNTGAIQGSRIQTISISCDNSLMVQHSGFDILNPSGPCGAATTTLRACIVNDWINCPQVGDALVHNITVQFSPLTGQPITSGVAVYPSPLSTILQVPTPVPTPSGYPALDTCVAGLQAANGLAVSLSLTVNQPAGQPIEGLVLFHKGFGGANPGESDTQGNTWYEATGANANSAGQINTSYVLTSKSTGSITVTANAPASGANNVAVLCTVQNVAMVDLASGFFSNSASVTSTQSGNVQAVTSRDLGLYFHYVETATGSFSGASSNITGTGTPIDLGSALGGTTTNATQIVSAGTEQEANGATIGVQRSFSPATTCCTFGGIIELSSVLIAATSVTPSCPSPIGIGGTSQCTVTAALTNGTSGSNPGVTANTTWVSNAPGIASVNATTGLVTGVSTGTATITGTYNGVSGQTTVTVATQTAGAANDEFAGPFASWINATTGATYGGLSTGCAGAANNGSTDATGNLQCLINYAYNNDRVLFFPAGTYLISSTLNGPQTQTNNTWRMVGQDPNTTMIKWNGASGGTMFSALEFTYSDMSRLTWNGNNTAGTIWFVSVPPGGAGGLITAFYDDVFENTQGGANGGGHGLSELSPANNDNITFVRDTFSNLGTALSFDGNNAGPYYLYDCTFLNNGTAWIQPNGNSIDAGFYNSVFVGSTSTDFNLQPGVLSPFTVVGNVSENSNRFIQFNGGNSAGMLIVRSNRVINTTQAAAVTESAIGGLIVLDNTFVSKAGNTSAPVVNSNGSSGNAVTAIGNAFTIAGTNGVNGSGLSIGGGPSSSRFIEVNDTYSASAGSISHGCPAASGNTSITDIANITVGNTCYPTPPNKGRHCFAGGVDQGVCNAATNQEESNPAANLQNDINAACPNGYTGGNRPVIHIPIGVYNIGSTISFPGINQGVQNCDVQLIGDGLEVSGGTQTELNWSGGGGPFMEMHFPSKVTVSEMSVNGPQGAAGFNTFRIDAGTDPVGGRVQVWSSNSNANGCILTNGTGNLRFNAMGLGCGPDNGGNAGNRITAVGNGSSSATGRIGIWAAQVLGFYCGSNGYWYGVSNQGNIISEANRGGESGFGCNNNPPMIQDNSGSSGSITLVGSDSTTYINSNDYGLIQVNNGGVTLTVADFAFYTGSSGNINFDGDWASAITNPTGSNVWISGIWSSNPNPPNGINYGSTVSQFQNFHYTFSSGTNSISDNGNGITNARILQQWAHLRGDGPVPDSDTGAGVTDVQFLRTYPLGTNYIYDVELGN